MRSALNIATHSLKLSFFRPGSSVTTMLGVAPFSKNLAL
jgi:hypothetical protein